MVRNWTISNAQMSFINEYYTRPSINYVIGVKNRRFLDDISLVLLLISNLTNGLRLHQFLVTKSEEANKSVKTDANGAH